MTTKNLSQVLRPIDHQRMIEKLTAKLNPATPTLNEETLSRIEWHTYQYTIKTGQLPK